MIGFIVAILWRDGFFVSEPEIAKDLPVGREDANALLTKRFVDKFPTGTPEKTPKDFLTDEGFWLGFRAPNDGNPMAKLFQNGICPRYWYVKWKTDNQDAIQEIEATHRNDCY